MGRATQGVKLINLRENDSIAAVAKVMKEEDDISDTDIKDIEVDPDDNGTDLDIE
jgi:DNA gyrase subunit A